MLVMKQPKCAVLWVLALLAVAGCTSTDVYTRPERPGERLARPGRIIVYDFAAAPADIPAWSDAAARYAASAPPQAAQREVGRALGAQVAQNLVAAIRGMGLVAVGALGQPAPQVNDIVLIGFFESLDEGSAAKRVVLGFGSGSAELTTHVEGYQMTKRGLRKLGSGVVEAGGGKTPGVAVPLAVSIATANPIGLIVGGAVKAGGEVTGKSTIEGTAARTAEAIAKHLRGRFEDQSWLP